MECRGSIARKYQSKKVLGESSRMKRHRRSQKESCPACIRIRIQCIMVFRDQVFSNFRM